MQLLMNVSTDAQHYILSEMMVESINIAPSLRHNRFIFEDSSVEREDVGIDT